MIYFLLPPANPDAFQHIVCSETADLPTQVVSHSLSAYLCEIKEKIAAKEHDWDIYKKYTNPFEYIHTVVPFKKKSVSKHKPLSRAYFKMIELVRGFNLVARAPKRAFMAAAPDLPPVRTFHLAEGPGGFIEAVCFSRANPRDVYYGMTILEDENDDNVPAWKKSDHFLRANPNVVIENGADGTGNLLHLANFDHCCAAYGSSMDLITADGGFDFSKDFNNQELTITRLLWGQIAYALAMQKLGGNFVLKMFDSFFQPTIDMLYILSMFYREVFLTKLNTSRVGNSEKYVVCKGFRFESNAAFLPFVRDAYIAASSTSPSVASPLASNGPEMYISRFLAIDIPRMFILKIEDCNSICGQQQIDNIYYTLALIDKRAKHDKIDHIVRQNVAKCINWCIEHNVPYNAVTVISAVKNMFI